MTRPSGGGQKTLHPFFALACLLGACSTPPLPAANPPLFAATDVQTASDQPQSEQDRREPDEFVPAQDEFAHELIDSAAFPDEADSPDTIPARLDAESTGIDEVSDVLGQDEGVSFQDVPAFAQDAGEIGLDATPTVADAAATGDTPDVADAPDTWTPPKGGAPGSNCSGQEGTAACSSDGKLRVECVNGAWTGIQHCGFGLCHADKSPGGAVLTTCAVPVAKLSALNAACARFLKCFPAAASHEDCVRANVYPGPFQAAITPGVALKVPDLALSELQAVPDCAQKATTCTDLAECLYFFPAQKCLGGASQGCDGDLGWTCVAAGKALAVNCAAFGTQCAVLNGAPTCVKSAACEGGAKAVTCAGTVATLCVQAGAKVVGLQRDCAAVGKACSVGAGSLDAACNGPVTAACSFGQGFSAACQGGKAVNCTSGATATTTCAPATSCAVEDQFGLFWPGCPTSQCGKAACTEGIPCAMAAKCNGSEVWFCEQKSPAAFDCKGVGMTCAMAATGPRCQ